MVVWRLLAVRDGDYDLQLQASDKAFTTKLVVGPRFERLSPVRSLRPFWQRLFVASAAILPKNSILQAIEVDYPQRRIPFAGHTWDWAWLFLFLSLCSAIFFKTVLRIEI